VTATPLPPTTGDGANPINGNDDHNEAHDNGALPEPISAALLNDLSPATNTPGVEVSQQQAAWSALPLSPCCEGGVNVRGSMAVLSATKTRALPPAPYSFPIPKDRETKMSKLESIPTEIIQNIARSLDGTAAHTALWLTSKQVMHTIGSDGNISRQARNRERMKLMSLFERDADDLVYCTPCQKLHFPVPFTNRDGSINPMPRQCELQDSHNLNHKLVCHPLDMHRHMVRWVSNLHGAGKQDLVDKICQQHFRDTKIRRHPSGADATWVETQRDVRVAENTSHVLLRTRHIVSFLDLCHGSGGLPSHRSIFYLVHYLKYVIEACGNKDICRHKSWAQNPDLSTFYQLEAELTANPHISGVGECETGSCDDAELAQRGLLSRLDPIETGRPRRIGGCCLFHEAPCPEAIGGCMLPTRGVIKSCEYCYTDFQWDILYKDEVEGTHNDTPGQLTARPEEGKDHWRERVLVLSTWKNLGRGCECTEHVWDSHATFNHEGPLLATNADRLPRDYVPTGARPNPARLPIIPGPRRGEWASDIFRAYERRAAVI